jgi:hypothetical protein
MNGVAERGQQPSESLERQLESYPCLLLCQIRQRAETARSKMSINPGYLWTGRGP